MSGRTSVAPALPGWRDLLPLPAAPLGYALRTALAVSIALYAAYWFELSNPSSAAVTAVIVSSPVRGAIISKSLWRFLGTVIGCFSAVLLAAVFAQSPWLYLSAAAIWLGVCTYLSSLMRYFRAYAAALAGYTLAIVGFGPALDAPDHIFEVALSRFSVVSLGVLSAGLVAYLLQSVTPHDVVEREARRMLGRVTDLLRRALDGAPLPELLAGRTEIGNQVGALDQQIEFGAAENRRVAGRQAALRQLMAHLVVVLVGTPRLRDRLATPGLPAPARETLEAGRRALRGLIAEADPQAIAAAAPPTRARLLALADATTDLTGLAVLAAMRDVVDDLAAAAALADPLAAPQRGVRLGHWRDHATALRAGWRAVLAVELTGLVWIGTAWPHGGTALTQLGSIVALAATNDRPAQGAMNFFWGILLASFAGYVCVFGLLPQVSGFPLLLLTYLPFIAIGAYAQTGPKAAGIAGPYMIFFVVLTAVANPISFNLDNYINAAIAYVLSAVGATFSFTVLIPPTDRQVVRQAARAVRRAVSRLAERRRLPERLAWEQMQHQKLLRIASRLPGNPARRDEVLTGDAALVLVGREVMRLRRALAAAEVPTAALPVVRHALAAIRRHPLRAAPEAATAATMLAQAAETRPAREAAAALHEIQTLLAGPVRRFAAG